MLLPRGSGVDAPFARQPAFRALSSSSSATVPRYGRKPPLVGLTLVPSIPGQGPGASHGLLPAYPRQVRLVYIGDPLVEQEPMLRSRSRPVPRLGVQDSRLLLSFPSVPQEASRSADPRAADSGE